ncbi:MAG: hypothetical protein KFW09_05185 [Oscillospiraceae bacterium]|nr:hypothetical protein [Oscillospiraceae bacterium]
MENKNVKNKKILPIIINVISFVVLNVNVIASATINCDRINTSSFFNIGWPVQDSSLTYTSEKSIRYLN